jgi:hypothetical protein
MKSERDSVSGKVLTHHAERQLYDKCDRKPSMTTLALGVPTGGVSCLTSRAVGHGDLRSHLSDCNGEQYRRQTCHVWSRPTTACRHPARTGAAHVRCGLEAPLAMPNKVAWFCARGYLSQAICRGLDVRP